VEQRRQTQAAQVKTWQETKDKEDAEAQAQQAAEMEQRRAAVERQRQERQAEVKAHVAGYVEVKEQERRQKIQLAKAAKKKQLVESRQLSARIETRNRRAIQELQVKQQLEQQEQQAQRAAHEQRLDKLRTEVGSALTLRMTYSMLCLSGTVPSSGRARPRAPNVSQRCCSESTSRQV
jgi:type IV secretory pathway VirB10-like protein